MNLLLPNSTGFMLQTMLYLTNHSSTNLLETVRSSNFDLELDYGAIDPNVGKCYGVYGCFPLTEPWITDKRPLAYYPADPIQMNVNFPVFTNRSRLIPKFLDLNDPDMVPSIGINPKGKIYFITHGYIESGDRPWIQALVNALLDNDLEGTASCVVIDWRGGSSPPYMQATSNIRLVGAIAAHAIHMLYQELNMPHIDNVHMIGHSLGSHLSGYAGYYLQRDFGIQLGRITGLDPAEPMFDDTDPLVRLDPSDAKFVDIIHSDSRPFVSKGGLGLFTPIGHVDFYPNGGYDQPGCQQSMQQHIEQESGSFFWGVQQFVGCNHIRSHQFFTESVSRKCPFMAITCESYEKFQRGECFHCEENSHQCIEFGLRSYEGYRRMISNGFVMGNKPLTAYLMTHGTKPFCRSHYKIYVKMSNSEESIIHGGEIGTLSVLVYGHDEDSTHKMKFSEEPMLLEPDHNYTSVVPGMPVSIPKHAILEWEYKTNPLNFLTWRLISSPRVYVDYVIVESLEHRSKIRLCSAFQMPVVAGKASDFRPDNCNHLPNDY